MIKKCEVCGELFSARKSDVRTCSPACKRKLLSRAMRDKGVGYGVMSLGLQRKTCMICNEIFEPNSGNQLTCSKKCSDILKRRRKADRKQAAQLEPIQFLPLPMAEDICRKLGMSYGAASAEAINCGLTLSRYLVIMADRKGISIFKEGEHDST